MRRKFQIKTFNSKAPKKKRNKKQIFGKMKDVYFTFLVLKGNIVHI